MFKLKFTEVTDKLSIFLTGNNLKTRPNVQPGAWLCGLLPTAIFISYFANQVVATELYRISVIQSAGLLITSVVIILKISKQITSLLANLIYLITTATVATVLKTSFYKGLSLSIFSGVFVTFGYEKALFFIIKLFPQSFSFGEASTCAQALVLFLFSHIVSLGKKFNGTVEISTLIIQIGLLSLGLLCISTYYLKFLRRPRPFYIFTAVTIFSILGVLHYLLKRSPILWIINLLCEDIKTIEVFLYWILCCIIAAFIIWKQIERDKKASTAVRKTFHILTVAVYMPGLLYKCNLLYLATGILLGIFIYLELMRVLNIEPLGLILQNGFHVYSDEKDVGLVALTPIYLLVGCSLPLWIHPEPCNILDSAGFNLLPSISGLLSVGIGDTAASVVGQAFGKHKWPGSQKTVEGTIACIFSQLGMIFILIQIGYAKPTSVQIIKAVVGIVFSSYIEAVTDQIDNLVLPFILYVFLI